MKKRRDKLESIFKPAKDKNLSAALAYVIATSFPKIGGERVVKLCTKMVMEVVDQHLKPKEHLHPGQFLYNAVSIDDPPSRGKTIAQTKQVTVILDLVPSLDIEKRISRESRPDRLLRRAIRLCKQAYRQGGVLTCADLALILGCSDSYISSLLAEYEREHEKIVPRRANIHDMGTGQTHKRIICLMRHRDGKSAADIARDTNHSDKAVDRYLNDFARVRFCLQQGMDIGQIRQAVDMSEQLVKQYVEINKELEDVRG